LDQSDNKEQTTQLRRSNRVPVPKSYKDYYLYSTQSDDPITVKEALSSSDTWNLGKLPSDRKAIQTKWIFKRKVDSDGNIAQFKARLVAKGCQQKGEVDYSETYAPVVRHASLRLLFFLAVKYDLDIDHMDAISAFLQGELSEEIYVTQPEGFKIKNKEHYVYKLNKAIYGLKQSGRAWNNKLHSALVDIGLQRSSRDHCVYFDVNKHKMIIVAAYVDDLLIFANDTEEKKKLKQELIKRFKIKDFGPVKSCLGIRITRDRKKSKLTLDKQKYTEEILSKFNMLDCNPVYTPLEHKLNLLNEAKETKHEDSTSSKIPYQEAVGSLMYLNQCTRPDITYAISYLSRFNQNPKLTHWKSVKRVLRYLKATINYKLEFSRDQEGSMIGFCDADWAGNLEDRRSVTGYIFKYQNGSISWASKKQPTIAISTTEVEYMSLAAATQEAIWLRDFFYEIMSLKEEPAPMQINCDNRSAIELSKTGNYKPRTKHIDVKHHFVREKIDNNIINVQHISSEHMIADILTKSLPAITHKKLLTSLGLKE